MFKVSIKKNIWNKCKKISRPCSKHSSFNENESIFNKNDENLAAIKNSVDALVEENKNLRKRIDYLENNANIINKIDEFVENWYESNKDLVDIGEVTICGRYKVDLIPDEMEKRLYSKMLKIVYSFLSSLVTLKYS